MKQSVFLGALFAFVLYWTINLYQPFLVDMAIAALLAIATSKYHILLHKLLPRKLRLKNMFVVTTLATLTLGMLLFGPIVYFLIASGTMLSDLDKVTMSLDKIQLFVLHNLDSLPHSLSFIRPKIEVFMNNFYDTGVLQEGFNIATNFGKSALAFIADIGLILTFYFFIGLYGSSMLSFFKKFSPLSERDMRMLYNETSQMMGIVFYSSIATAVLEGFLFGIMVSFFGYDGLFLGILYGFASLVPIVGGVMMWAPLSLWELSNNNAHTAFFIAFYSIIVISIMADTFIKPMIIGLINKQFAREETGVNSLLIFFSIVAGLGAYGFWGVILGPAITALFIAILKIYSNLKLQNPPLG